MGFILRCAFTGGHPSCLLMLRQFQDSSQRSFGDGGGNSWLHILPAGVG